MQRADKIARSTLFVIAYMCSARWTLAAQLYPYFEGSPPDHYVNPTFNLNVTVPSGMLACQSDTGATTSHGFWISFSGASSCEADGRKSSFINVYVGFEAAYDAESPKELAEALCGKSVVEMPDLQIPGQKTVVCQEPYLERDARGKPIGTGNRLKTTVLTLVGGQSGTELEVSLITTEGEWMRNAPALKRVLSGVTISGR